MTENEMRAVLIDLRKEYAPDQSFDFIHQLSLDDLQELFDLISTKNSWEQETKRKNIEHKMHFARISINMILQKIKTIKIQMNEKKDQNNDVESIEKLENSF